MCGRAILTVDTEEIASIFGVAPIPISGPRYNLSPGQDVVVLRARDDADEMASLRWGLVPWWSKEPKRPFPQARAETVLKTAAFRSAKRCLIVFDGFYEWQTETRDPFLVRRAHGEPFTLAGVWDTWNDKQTCAVITTASHGPLARIHDRMPLVIDAERRAAWLHGGKEEAAAIVAENDIEKKELSIQPISKHVNNVKNDDPRCIEPLTG